VTPSEVLPDDLSGESRFQLLTRLGFAGRGLLYILIAALVILTGRTEDLTGAMEYLGKGLGKGLLIILAAGMTVYGLWRLCDAAFGIESGRHHWRAWRMRIASASSGIIYSYLAWKAVRLLVFENVAANEAQRHASEALNRPGGEMLLLIAAGILLGTGVAQLIKAANCHFLDPLDCTDGQKAWIRWLGRLGYGARGLVFLVLSYLLAQAAWKHNAAEAGGLEQALDFFSPALRGWVAAGLALFGLLSLVEARYRRIRRPPPVDEVAEKLVEKVRA
jgi:hypothetical protein